MTTKHTPGPWKAQQDCRSYRNAGIFDGKNPDSQGNQNAWGIYGRHTRIAVLHEAESWRCQELVNADARLIAAAPDLLEALERLTRFHENGGSHRHSLDFLVRCARLAIEKATGESK